MSELEREALLRAAAAFAYQLILQCVLRGGYDPRSLVGDFALDVAGIVKDRVANFTAAEEAAYKRNW